MAQDDTAPEPPAVSVDQVELRPVGLRRAKVLSGVIEDVIAESVVIRRTAGAPDVVPLRDVATLRFQKPVDYEAGLKLLQNYRWSEALPLITKALDEEQRPWVIREIRAARAEIFRAQRRYDDCIREVEQILDSDPDTRHLLLLPLVWDERLEESARYIGRAEDLQSDSECRRLVTATALLHESAHQQQAEAVLRDLKRNGRGSMGAIVELQLWRLSLLTTGAIRELAVEQWQVRLREFQRELRGPGEWICGRALMVLNDYDRALTALLWMPLVAPLDPASTAAAIQDAVVAAKQAGRPGEAAALTLERELWLSRMGQASAVGDTAEERSGSAGEQRSAEK
jgi:tetratricopeptide (TPR) repeat protein